MEHTANTKIYCATLLSTTNTVHSSYSIYNSAKLMIVRRGAFQTINNKSTTLFVFSVIVQPRTLFYILLHCS